MMRAPWFVLRLAFVVVANGSMIGSATLLPARSLAGARVVADEIVTTTTPSPNGSSPVWSVGAPLLVRTDDTIWASISVHDPEAAPYCNTHWELWRRPDAGVWEKLNQGPAGMEREPCPLALPDPKSLVLSIHPGILQRGTDHGGEKAWFCQPALAVFEPERLDRDPDLWTPVFDPGASFGQHSYRSLGVDPAHRSMLLLVIDREGMYCPTWRDGEGAWYPLPSLEFPVRACYPNVVLRNRVGHVLAIGDIEEPNPAWRAEKFRVLKREWDYAFRRLFYAWSPDLAVEGFRPPVEVDSVDDTAGWMFNMDMLVDTENRVHLLWVRRNFEYDFLRDRFFAGQTNIESVMHAVIERGRLVARETLLSREVSVDAAHKSRFTSGRLHELPDGRLLAVLVAEAGPKASGQAVLLQELDPLARASPAPVPVPLERPPPTGWFFTNTTRGGSPPDRNLHLLGAESRDGIVSVRHIHVRVP